MSSSILLQELIKVWLLHANTYIQLSPDFISVDAQGKKKPVVAQARNWRGSSSRMQKFNSLEKNLLTLFTPDSKSKPNDLWYFPPNFWQNLILNVIRIFLWNFMRNFIWNFTYNIQHIEFQMKFHVKWWQETSYDWPFSSVVTYSVILLYPMFHHGFAKYRVDFAHVFDVISKS